MNPNLLLPGDPRGADWGYSVERWGGSFLYFDGDRVVCALLHAGQEGRGYFRTLMQGIERSGYRVAVPTPLADMQRILEHYGFGCSLERLAEGEAHEVWEKPVKASDPPVCKKRHELPKDSRT